LWSISLMIVEISFAENFSIGKSILNFFLPILVIFVPLFLILLMRGNWTFDLAADRLNLINSCFNNLIATHKSL